MNPFQAFILICLFGGLVFFLMILWIIWDTMPPRE